MTSRYDIWKTASPPEYEMECCEECFSPSHDTNFGRGDVAIPEGCKDEDCFCHNPDDDGDARYDAMRDDELTRD